MVSPPSLVSPNTVRSPDTDSNPNSKRTSAGVTKVPSDQRHTLTPPSQDQAPVTISRHNSQPHAPSYAKQASGPPSFTAGCIEINISEHAVFLHRASNDWAKIANKKHQEANPQRNKSFGKRLAGFLRFKSSAPSAQQQQPQQPPPGRERRKSEHSSGKESADRTSPRKTTAEAVDVARTDLPSRPSVTDTSTTSTASATAVASVPPPLGPRGFRRLSISKNSDSRLAPDKPDQGNLEKVAEFVGISGVQRVQEIVKYSESQLAQMQSYYDWVHDKQTTVLTNRKAARKRIIECQKELKVSTSLHTYVYLMIATTEPRRSAAGGSVAGGL
jgi:plasmid stabilization system protein ParE